MGRLNNSNLVEERTDSTYDNLTVLISKWNAEMRILVSTASHLDRVSIQLSAGIMREQRRWRGFDCAMHRVYHTERIQVQGRYPVYQGPTPCG
jgi:hypothetical protein